MPTPDTTVRRNPWTWLSELVRHHRRIVVLWIAVGMLAGGLYGLLGPGGHVAESRLLVGTFEAPAAAIPGYVLASQTVAGNYARLATSSAVYDKLPTDLSLTPDQISSMVSVTAIPDSAIIRVVATDADANAARTASEAMAKAIDAAVADLNATRSGDAVLAEYSTAAQELSAATAQQTAAQDALTRAQQANAPTSQAVADAQAAYDSATVAVDTAKLKVQGIATQYQTQQETVSTSSQVRVLGGATVTEKSRLLSIVSDMVIGAVLGVVIGIGLAWRRERRDRREVESFEPAEPAEPAGVAG